MEWAGHVQGIVWSTVWSLTYQLYSSRCSPAYAHFVIDHFGTCPPCCFPPPRPPPQAKRLEELDALYRDEAIMRKKIFNQVRAGGAEQRLCASDSWRLGAA